MGFQLCETYAFKDHFYLKLPVHTSRNNVNFQYQFACEKDSSYEYNSAF